MAHNFPRPHILMGYLAWSLSVLMFLSIVVLRFPVWFGAPAFLVGVLAVLGNLRGLGSTLAPGHSSWNMVIRYLLTWLLLAFWGLHEMVQGLPFGTLLWPTTFVPPPSEDSVVMVWGAIVTQWGVAVGGVVATLLEGFND